MVDKYHIDWHMLSDAVDVLGTMIQESQLIGPTVLVGLTRGGLVPTVMLSNIMDIPMLTLDYSSNVGNGEKAGTHKNDPSEILDQLRQYDNVVIVDDLTDTGFTLSELVDYFSGTLENINIVTAVVVHKSSSMFVPNMQAIYVDDNSWIVFPWEK